MDQAPYAMDETRRRIVLDALREAAGFRAWMLLVVQVRALHTHIVVHAHARPERVLNTFKTYASRRLNEAGLDAMGRKRWARHGSTLYLWNRKAVENAVHYVLNEQGDRMTVFENPNRLKLYEVD